jgi:hypothetical protein
MFRNSAPLAINPNKTAAIGLSGDSRFRLRCSQLPKRESTLYLVLSTSDDYTRLPGIGFQYFLDSWGQ